MFGKRMCFSVFYYYFYVKDISIYISEDHVAEDRYPYMNEEQDIILDAIREEHYRYVSEEGDDKKKINYLIWEVYVKEKDQFIKRQFLVSVPHPKGGAIFWTCVKDHIINGKEYYKYIGLHGFDYKLFEEQEGGGTREGLYGYHF